LFSETPKPGAIGYKPDILGIARLLCMGKLLVWFLELKLPLEHELPEVCNAIIVISNI